MEKPSLEKKPHTKNIICSENFFLQWLFQGEFWKDNVQGFLNLVLKVALRIWKFKQTMPKDTLKYEILIDSQV